MESTTGYTFTNVVRYFTSEWLIIAPCKKGPTAFIVSSEKHWQRKSQKFPNDLSGIRAREHSIVNRAL